MTRSRSRQNYTSVSLEAVIHQQHRKIVETAIGARQLAYFPAM